LVEKIILGLGYKKRRIVLGELFEKEFPKHSKKFKKEE